MQEKAISPSSISNKMQNEMCILKFMSGAELLLNNLCLFLFMNEKSSLYPAIAFLLVLMLLGSYLYFTSRMNNERSENPVYEEFGSLKFPANEGQHGSAYESYSVYFNLSSEGKNYYFMVIWSSSHINSISSYSTEFFFSDPAQNRSWVESYTDMQVLNSSENSLKLNWKTPSGDIFYIEKLNNKEKSSEQSIK